MESENKVINAYYNRIFKTARVLFVLEGCPYCRAWKKFIERINFELEDKKKIEVVDATNFSVYGIYDDPLLRIFDKYITGYPTMFIEGTRISGANSRAEAEAFLRTFVHEDFLIPQNNPFLFEKECRIVKHGFFNKKTLVCDDPD